jgi:hypothetical protein
MTNPLDTLKKGLTDLMKLGPISDAQKECDDNSESEDADGETPTPTGRPRHPTQGEALQAVLII